MILDHIGIGVTDLARSKAFYIRAFAPLRIRVMLDLESWIGMGHKDHAEFWFGRVEVVGAPIHVAFTARSRAEVRAFYDAALAAGGKDHGAPGLRPEYHADYYGAFVIDPDGHNIEAVCHAPER
jgi:catechol 2,3-dioxygenase-like lactoylglutathione lyase family enzyme